MDRAVFVNDPVFRAESCLGHFEAHREKAEDRDPQRCTWAAEADRDRDTRNVAEPNRAREFGGERLERAHLARVGLARVAAAHDINRVLEARDRLKT